MKTNNKVVVTNLKQQIGDFLAIPLELVDKMKQSSGNDYNILLKSYRNTVKTSLETWTIEKKRAYFKSCMKEYMKLKQKPVTPSSFVCSRGSILTGPRYHEIKKELDEKVKNLLIK